MTIIPFNFFSSFTLDWWIDDDVFYFKRLKVLPLKPWLRSAWETETWLDFYSQLTTFPYFYVPLTVLMAIKIDVKWRMILVTSFLVFGGFLKTSEAQQKFDKTLFYQVMASGDTEAINKEINIVAESTLSNKEGYDGALLMRKAGLMTKPKEKLRLFKSGMTKIETALLVDSVNTEFHFLRLVIEEQAPKIVKYNTHIEKDKIFIQNNFKSVSPVVQHAILDYCKNSKVLHAGDF